MEKTFLGEASDGSDDFKICLNNCCVHKDEALERTKARHYSPKKMYFGFGNSCAKKSSLKKIKVTNQML